MIDARREGPEPAAGRLSGLLAAARGGSNSDVGELLEATRRYLLLVANRSLDAQLQQKVAPSDLVQETFIDAHRDFGRFEGHSEAEFVAWLCHILQHKAADAGRKFRCTAKRNVSQEQSLDLPTSSGGPQVACQQPTPSKFVVHSENEQRLARVIETLPGDYRQVIELRSFERLSFAEVGRQMGRSEDAAGKLWFRAIQKLREALAGTNDSGCSFV